MDGHMSDIGNVQKSVDGETYFCTLDVAAQIEQKRAGRRKLVRHGGRLCSKCLERPPAASCGYCNPCHAAHMRQYRARSKPPETEFHPGEYLRELGKEEGVR